MSLRKILPSLPAVALLVGLGALVGSVILMRQVSALRADLAEMQAVVNTTSQQFTTTGSTPSLPTGFNLANWIVDKANPVVTDEHLEAAHFRANLHYLEELASQQNKSAFATLVQMTSIMDSDRDGVADMSDMCPLLPGENGESCPTEDADQDGVVDALDRCPAENGSDYDFVFVGGLPIPDASAWGVLASRYIGCVDSDNDHIPDAVDACIGENNTPDTDLDGCLDSTQTVEPSTVAARQITKVEAIKKDSDGKVRIRYVAAVNGKGVAAVHNVACETTDTTGAPLTEAPPDASGIGGILNCKVEAAS